MSQKDGGGNPSNLTNHPCLVLRKSEDLVYQVPASSTDIFAPPLSVFFLIMDLQMRNLLVEDQSDFHAAQITPGNTGQSPQHQEIHQGKEGGANLIGKD